MVRGTVENAKMPPDNNTPKYEGFYINDLFWSVPAVFGRFRYGKRVTYVEENFTNFIFFIRSIAARQLIVIVFYGNLFYTPIVITKCSNNPQSL